MNDEAMGWESGWAQDDGILLDLNRDYQPGDFVLYINNRMKNLLEAISPSLGDVSTNFKLT